MAQRKTLFAITISTSFQKSIKTEKHRPTSEVCLLWQEPLMIKNNTENFVMHDLHFFFREILSTNM